MTNNFFTFTFAAVAALCLSTAKSSLSEEPTKVLTYNIRYENPGDGKDVWANRSSAVIETIRGADIAGLQEVVRKQMNDIAVGTKEWVWYGVGRDDGEDRGEMTPIGWRKDLFESIDYGTFWLSEQPDTVGQKSWDAALPRIASWAILRRRSDQQRLLIVNTHFDHVGAVARKNSASLIRKWINEHRQVDEQWLPVILLGDLNAELTSPPLQELLLAERAATLPLDDALALTQTKAAGPSGTWNGFREIVADRRIDHVLVLGKVFVRNYTTLDPRTTEDRFASDHLPIQIAVDFEEVLKP